MSFVIDKEKCCGCMACLDSCPKKAISKTIDKGFYYPIINESLCVGCNKCHAVCPMLNKIENDDYDDFDTSAYAAWNSSDEKLKDSTSGGMFVAFAEKFIENGGCVCGCEFASDFKSCHHSIISQKSEINRIIHSKYFQSDTSGIYQEIDRLLRNNTPVLFCGTPCQCAGLFNYIDQKNRDKLTIVDLFCKGVPSPIVHKKYVEILEKKARSKVSYFRSKSKVKGWGKFFTEVVFENGKTLFVRSPLDNLFVDKCLNVRPSCSACKYKGYDRVSDITIGDYWGVSGLDNEIVKKGVSALIINTEKGQQLIESLEDTIIKREKSVFEISNHRNPGFSKTIVLGKQYSNFYNDLEKKPFRKVIKKYASNNSKLAIAWRKFKWAFSKLKYVSIHKFIYLNFFCSHIKRKKGAYIIPGPHSIFEFEKGSELIVEKGRVQINCIKPKGSKVESWIQLNEGAKMIIHGSSDMRNSRFIVQKDAVLEIGDLEMNGLCNIVVRKNVKIGNGVMIARGVNIYDSDYHPFSLYDDIQTVSTKPVVIKDHVWIGNGASIMKGVTIGEGAVISARAVVVKNVKPRSMVFGNPAEEIAKDIYWSKGH